MTDEAEELELALLVAWVAIQTAGQVHSVIRCPMHLIQMFSMCKCCPECSSRCLLKLSRSAFHPSEKCTYIAVLVLKVTQPNFSLHNKQPLQLLIHSLITRIHKTGVLITLHAASIASTSVSTTTPGKVCARVCVCVRRVEEGGRKGVREWERNYCDDLEITAYASTNWLFQNTFIKCLVRAIYVHESERDTEWQGACVWER